MKRKFNYGDLALVLLFLVLIFAYGIWSFILPDKDSSKLENRSLALRPDATIQSVLFNKYFKRYETYFNDQFPARNFWIEANADIDKYLFHKTVIRDIYVSPDGYMIDPVNPKNGMSTELIANKINQFTKKVEQKNTDVYFALVPDKATIMEDKLPKYFPGVANKLSDKVMSYFSKKTDAMDLRQTIKQHMDEKNMYFYTDHHWKPKAAYYAYENIINTMAQRHPQIGKPVPKSAFTWEEYPKPFLGSLARKTTKSYVSKADTVTIVQPKFKEKKYSICYRGKCGRGFYNFDILKSPDIYANRYVTYFDGDVPEGVVKNPNNNNGLKLLILKDSYANAMIQFLARNFSETRVLDLRHYNKMSVYKYINDNNIDCVLFVHNINSLVLTPAFLNFNHPGKN